MDAWTDADGDEWCKVMYVVLCKEDYGVGHKGQLALSDLHDAVLAKQLLMRKK